jgi:hypothetical protein
MCIRAVHRALRFRMRWMTASCAQKIASNRVSRMCAHVVGSAAYVPSVQIHSYHELLDDKVAGVKKRFAHFPSFPEIEVWRSPKPKWSV